jgi:hypothetical protein
MGLWDVVSISNLFWIKEVVPFSWWASHGRGLSRFGYQIDFLSISSFQIRTWVNSLVLVL